MYFIKIFIFTFLAFANEKRDGPSPNIYLNFVFSMEDVKKMISESNSELSRTIKAIPVGVKKEEVGQMIEKTTKALPPSLKKDEVTQMIEKSLKSLPAPLKKEEVIQLIDKATSNFLKTVKCKICTFKRWVSIRKILSGPLPLKCKKISNFLFFQLRRPAAVRRSRTAKNRPKPEWRN